MQPQIITIFISAPKDCLNEKAIVAKEVKKLAMLIKDAYNVDLKLLTFENDTFSSMGSDGQDVVNTQIGDKYDVYLGLMRSRLGTPTPRSTSGTVEEYERALARYRIEGSPRMLFFEIDFDLKNSETNLDVLSELQRVKEFVNRLRSDGMLTRTVTAEDIDIVIYTHLYKTLNSAGLIKKSVVEDGRPTEEEIGIASEEMKILSDKTGAAQFSMHDNLLRQRDVIARFDGENSWRSKWMYIGGNFIVLRPKTEEEIHEASVELNSITSEMRDLLRDFRPKYRAYIEASVNMFSHPSMMRGITGIQEYFRWANGLQSLMAGAANHLTQLTQMYGNLRDLSPEFTAAKSRLVSLLREMATDYRTSRDLLWIVVKTAMETTGQYPINLSR